MPLSVLIAPDKFKGTLTAKQAANAIASGWKAARPKDRLTQLPISDGGDGFGPLMAKLMRARTTTAFGRDAAHRDIQARWWFDKRTQTNIIESAKIIGLATLPPDRFHPFELDSEGIAWVLNHATTGRWIGFTVNKHPMPNSIVGVGGSATNDGGFGLAIGLGWEFRIEKDNEDSVINKWTDLHQLEQIYHPNPDCLKQSGEIIVAVDVQNPLLGPNGCTRVYGPQKGLREEDIPKAEAALTRLAEVWEVQTGEDAASLPGAGAAGGLGFGLHCFAGAQIRSGFEIFAEAAKLPALLKKAELVVTGEGAMDRQTVMGKGVGEVAKLAGNHDCRCIGLAGKIENRPLLLNHMENCRALTDVTSPAEAEKDAAHWLEKLAHSTAQSLKSPT